MSDALLPTDDVWLVIPLYNEETVIGDVVREARRSFPNVVVIDDGSSDGGAQAAQAAGAVVVRHPVNLGQGAALQTGFEYARSVPSMRWVVTFDADGQHQVSDVVDMLDKARAEDLQVVFGPRFLDDRTTPTAMKNLVLRLAVGYPQPPTGTQLTSHPNGPLSHYGPTGPEIWRDTDGRVTHFVTGAGTGGTISGAGRYLHEVSADRAEGPVRVIAADPEGSVYSGGSGRPYLVEGVGEDFFPAAWDPDLLDDIIPTSDEESFLTARYDSERDGILIGGSGGVRVPAARKVA